MMKQWYKLIVIMFLAFCTGACMHTQMGDRSEIKKDGPLSAESKPRVLIVYQSKYGSTKQYAQWINKDIPSDLVDAEKGDKPEFAGYDVIVFGGYIRMGGIVIAPLIVKSWGDIKAKKVILFTVSGTPPGHPNIEKIYHSDLPGEIRKEIKYFPLRGKIVSKDLSFFDKFLVAVGRIMERDESLRSLMTEDYDEVKPGNLIPLLEYMKTLSLQKEKSIRSANPVQ
jgi:menaquinone-dependent protoporphyrinogen IX oxidase